MDRKSIGIIGFGRFGQLAAMNLKEHFMVFVSDIVDRREDAKKIGVNFAPLNVSAAKEVILLCVPISTFESALKQIIPFLKRGALVIDVCSVKEMPVETMAKLVPKEVECIGTHPLFGPDTAENGIRGKKIVICPIRTKRISQIKNFLTKLELTVIMADPKEHDKQMARSLSLVHLLGTILNNLGIERNEMTTPTHGKLMELVDIVKNDSNQLFVDIQTQNRFTKQIRKMLIDELIRIDNELS